MSEKVDLQFEPEAIKALTIIENTNQCLFFTWKAGAWKSTTINFYKEHTKKKYVLLWTTGVSAEMIGGETIHKFFALQPWKKWTYSALTTELKEYIQTIDVFIIDESSMLRADLFDLLEKLMRKIMWNDLFFGWKQFIFVWDLYQLPPVPEKKYLSDSHKKKDLVNPAWERYEAIYKWLYFFQWVSYQEEFFEKVELQKVWRQDDPQFVYMLNRIRAWEKSLDIINYFNKKVIKKEEIHEHSILVSTTNAIANKYNDEKLNELPWELKYSKAFVDGEYPDYEYPMEEWIRYKVWGRVMFTVNDKEEYYKNWTLWTITEIYQNSIKILKDDWTSIEVWRKTWLNVDWEDSFWNKIVLWKFIQYPFKTAFWITIHKCQWKSFDHVVIDFGWGAFASWQAYTAISRGRTYEWLQFLKKMKLSDIKVSDEVVNFLKK